MSEIDRQGFRAPTTDTASETHIVLEGLPFVPEHALGYVFEKPEGDRLVYWPVDGSVEPAELGTASRLALDLFENQLANRRRPLRVTDGLLESAYDGFVLVGTRECSFMSGTLYQQATMMLDIAREANARRTALVTAYGGREPSTEGDWLEFCRATTTTGAACNGVEVIAMGAVEAFANEVLGYRFDFSRGSLRRLGVIKKVGTLCSLLHLNADSPRSWLCTLEEAQKRRSDAVVHFKPECRDHNDLRVDGLRPHDISETERLMMAVHELHLAVFAAFQQPVSQTHWHWRADAEASWPLIAHR